MYLLLPHSKKAPSGPRPFWTSFSHVSLSARGGVHKEKQIANGFEAMQKSLPLFSTNILVCKVTLLHAQSLFFY